MADGPRWPDEQRRASSRGKSGESVHVWDAGRHVGDKKFAEFVHDPAQRGIKTAARFAREDKERDWIKKKSGK